MAADVDYRGVTVAVLGASGFIGRWVARHLTDAGARVILIVRNSASLPPSVRKAAASVIEADLSHEDAVRDLIASVSPAVVFNLAGYGVDRAERDEGLAHFINTELPAWIARFMPTPDDSWAGQRVVHAGSALEYGEIGGNLAENSTPNPTTLYGRTKLAGTLALARECKERGIHGSTARLFTVYGPGEHTGRLLPTLLDAAAHDEVIPMSAGLQRRDFTYVEDVAEGLLRLGACTTARHGEVVNIATGRLTRVRDFAIEAARVLGIGSERLDFGAFPTRTEEMQHDPVSVARLRELIGWVPQTDITSGVSRTLAEKQKSGDRS